jgi:hypothetical protein
MENSFSGGRYAAFLFDKYKYANSTKTEKG